MSDKPNTPVVEFPFAHGFRDRRRGSEESDAERGRAAMVRSWRVIKRNRWGILGVALLATVFGLVTAWSEPPAYRATLSLLVEPGGMRVASPGQWYLEGNPWKFFHTQRAVIESRAVAERVAELLTDEERRELLSRPAAPTGLWHTVRGFIGMSPNADELAPPEPAVSAEQRAVQIHAAARAVQGGLRLFADEQSQIFTITFESHSPVMAARVANVVAKAYAEFTVEERASKSERATAWLGERIDELRKKLVDSENALQEYQRREGLIDTDRIKQMESGRLSKLNDELVAAQTNYNELSKRYGARHPKMVQATSELETIRARLKDEQKTIVGAKQLASELARLEREVAANRELYDVFLNRFRETDVAGGEKNANVRVLDAAEAPAAPYRPNKPKIVGTWFTIGLMLGIMLAFGREYLDNTFKTPADVEDKLGQAVLGTVPLLAREKKTALPDWRPERQFITESRSSFAEAINHIRTGVLFSHVDNPPRTVLVTSSVQEEGKTTLSSNLALSFAQLGRTLLVDADLRKPRVALVSGIDRSAGLVELVAGQTTFKEAIVRDRESANLFILRSGTMPPNPLELLSSGRVAKLFEELKGHFEHIVIDTAPVLPVSDAVVLGRIVDATILVIQADRTAQALARDALKRMAASRVHPIGVVLTKVSHRKMSSYYGRYYYENYYHSYYGADDEQRRKSSAT